MNQKERPKSLGYLLVVGGPGGSGASTIARMLADHFSLKRVYGGKIFRSLLRKAGFEDMDSAYTKKNEKLLTKLDKQVDAMLLDESKEKNVLIESKNFAALATKRKYPCTVKIWITASLNVRTQRTLMKNSIKIDLKHFPKYLEERKHLKDRYKMDSMRYSSLYGINYDKPEEYNDIVIESSNLNEEETFNLILKYIKDGGYIK